MHISSFRVRWWWVQYHGKGLYMRGDVALYTIMSSSKMNTLKMPAKMMPIIFWKQHGAEATWVKCGLWSQWVCGSMGEAESAASHGKDHVCKNHQSVKCGWEFLHSRQQILIWITTLTVQSLVHATYLLFGHRQVWKTRETSLDDDSTQQFLQLSFDINVQDEGQWLDNRGHRWVIVQLG